MEDEKLLNKALADIETAKKYYEEHIQPDLLRRYAVYQSDRDRYAQMYRETSKLCDFRTFDLWSAVEWMLPAMIRAFFGSDRIISISGMEGEDADRAEKIMGLIQWQLTVKNAGYRIFKNWFADSLSTNMGLLKCYWKRETEKRQKQVNRAELIGMMQGGVKILASDPVFTLYGEPMSMITYDVITTNQPVVECVRPGDIRYVPDAPTLRECSMVAHRKIVTVDELRRDARRGVYDADAVEAVAIESKDGYTPTDLDIKQNNAEDSSAEHEDNNESGRLRVEVFECYMKTDLDGDGLLEDAIVTVCGKRLLRAVENPYGRVPIFELVPFTDPYQVWSKVGLPEIIEGIQDMHTGLIRQMMVALGLSNQPHSLINETLVNVEDIRENRQYIRVKGGGDVREAFYPIPANGLNPQNFQLFEYMREQLEQWIGITRYNQGTDANSLNKTATGINMIMSASQQRQDEIVRNAAETIRELFRFLIKINQMYLDQPQVIRLQNDIIQFSPDDLGGEFDISVDASAGVGARDGKVQALTRYLREMWPFAAQIGVATPDQFVMAAQKLLKLMGIEDAEKYISIPQFNPMMMAGMAPPGQGGMPVGLGAGQGAGALARDGAGGQPGAVGAV